MADITLTITIGVRLAKASGPYVAKEALAEAIVDELSGSDPGEISVEESTYEVGTWDVNWE